MRRLLTVLLIGTLFLVALTYAALEGGGVITVRTQVQDNQNHTIAQTRRDTHIWFVEAPDGLWLEAGHPENGWFRDLAGLEALTLLGGGLDGDYAFHIDDGSNRARIRGLLRQKYGWRDWWVAVIFSTDQSIMVRLQPLNRRENHG